MLKLLSAPADNERTPLFMEKALAAVHQALTPGQAFCLGYGIYRGRIGLFCRFPKELEGAIIGPLIANYPRASIEEVTDRDDPRQHRRDDRACWTAKACLEPEVFPILRHAQFDDLLNRRYADPIDSLLRAVRPTDDSECLIELTVTPASHKRCDAAQRVVRALDRKFFHAHPRFAEFYATFAARRRWRWLAWMIEVWALQSEAASREGTLEFSAARSHEREAALHSAADKAGAHVFEVAIRTYVWAATRQQAQARVQAVAGALGALTRSRLATFHVSRLVRGHVQPSQSFLCSHEELATIWHPAVAGTAAERMQVSPFTELEPPGQFCNGTEPGSTTMGRVLFRGDERAVGLELDARRRHVYMVGRTGVGKSTLLLNQIHADLEAGHGVSVIDPHGDLAEAVLCLVPKRRTGDVVLVDPADQDSVVPFNPLACNDPMLVDRVTSSVVSAFRRIHDSWGPRLESLLRQAVYATVEQDGTFVTLLQLLTDEGFRERTVPSVEDPIVRAFFEHEFRSWSKQYRTEAVASITNKIHPFLAHRGVRTMMGHSGRSIDLRKVMDARQILIVNLSKGRLGEDNALLLGTFLVSSLYLAAMGRLDQAEGERGDHFLYVDEFHNFLTSSLESILSEARKVRLCLTLAHQYLGQLNEATRAAVAGNVGSMTAFAVGSEDAEWVATALSKFPGQVRPSDLTSLPKYTAYCRLLIDGLPSPPFSIRTLPPPDVAENRAEIVRQLSRRQHSQKIAALAKGSHRSPPKAGREACPGDAG